MTRPLDGNCDIKIIKFNGNKDANGDPDEEADKLGACILIIHPRIGAFNMYMFANSSCRNIGVLALVGSRARPGHRTRVWGQADGTCDFFYNIYEKNKFLWFLAPKINLLESTHRAPLSVCIGLNASVQVLGSLFSHSIHRNSAAYFIRFSSSFLRLFLPREPPRFSPDKTVHRLGHRSKTVSTTIRTCWSGSLVRS